MAIPATYLSPNSLQISGEYDNEYPDGRRLQANQGTDGLLLTSAVSASYDAEADLTTIVTLSSALTVNLVSIKKGVGDKTSLGLHYHTSDEDDAGYLPASALSAEQVAQLIALCGTLPTE